MNTRGQQTRKYLYLGTIEITQDCVILSPEPESAAQQAQILADFVDEEGWVSPSREAASLYTPSPVELLDLVAVGTFEAVPYETQDEQALALAREALAEGPYTAAFYAIGVTLIPGTSSRFVDVRPLAFRTGSWRDAHGTLLPGDARAVAARTALADIAVRDGWMG